MRWLWLKKSKPEQPWAGLDLPVNVNANAKAMFEISVTTIVGHSTTVLFWTDRWIHGNSIQDLALALIAFISRWIQSQWMVSHNLEDPSWVRDIKGGLSIAALFQYQQLWDIL